MKTQLSVLLLAIVGVAFASIVASAQPVTIPAGASVYIEPIDTVLDEHLRAEITRQKVAVNVVVSRDEAQILIVGAERINDPQITPQSNGSVVLRVNRQATVVVQDKATGSTLWSGMWAVRSYNEKELRKAASDLVGKLKKAVRPTSR